MKINYSIPVSKEVALALKKLLYNLDGEAGFQRSCTEEDPFYNGDREAGGYVGSPKFAEGCEHAIYLMEQHFGYGLIDILKKTPECKIEEEWDETATFPVTHKRVGHPLSLKAKDVIVHIKESKEEVK